MMRSERFFKDRIAGENRPKNFSEKGKILQIPPLSVFFRPKPFPPSF